MQERKEQSKVEISVVTYVRNEEDIIERNIDEMVGELENLGRSYEIIAVNVPSKDNSYEVMTKLADKHEHFYPINMVNVYGDTLQKGYQILLGFRVARGKNIILTDSDGQPDPRDFKALLDKLDEGYDVVNGWRTKGETGMGLIYNLSSMMYNLINRVLTRVPVHDQNCGIKAFKAPAAKSITLYGRNFRYMILQLLAKGFKITEVPVHWRKREGGIANFGFMDRLFGGTMDALIAFFVVRMVDKPFRMWGAVSFLFGFLGFISLIKK